MMRKISQPPHPELAWRLSTVRDGGGALGMYFQASEHLPTDNSEHIVFRIVCSLSFTVKFSLPNTDW